MADIPVAAVAAAMKVAPEQHLGLGRWVPACTEREMQRILEAAAPALVQAERDRAARLAALADDILGRFVRTSAGYRARAGQVQIRKWEAALASLREPS